MKIPTNNGARYVMRHGAYTITILTYTEESRSGIAFRLRAARAALGKHRAIT